ncbi:nucleoside-diphosphate kinase [Candidatus Dojkabacteria bacterium]|uniref:nucleoside-diphosphate kinase n=1 Tax=Candidatus Dojkabacteria bacterium TaxID=2099670 RepID=A0A3M0YZH0_9BACT|nr:MAG: nucleoside-diphosphate kinase [Candidatus Dojkabacteria bacterium]
MKNKPTPYERTLVLLKPDAVQRGLMGEIISRFERKGLKIVAMKFLQATKQQAQQHYYWSDEEKTKTGNRTIEVYKNKGIELKKSAIEVAEDVQKRLVNFMLAGPILVMVIEGAHAIEHVRKIVGHGSPLQADVGTIRADYTIDSYLLADEADRAARNLVHASSSTDEAEREIRVWFSEDEICDYELAIEKILYSKEWESGQK